jgi:O-antigen/teichoic acid export membrane protein
MGIVIKQSAKTLFVTYLGFILGIINTLWLFPLALTEEQIGLTRLLINVSFLFSTFAALGSVQVPNKFFFYFKDNSKQHHGFLFFLLLVASTGFLLFVVLFNSFKGAIFSIYIEKARLLTEYFYYLIPLTFFILFTNILESYNTIQSRPVIPSFLREFLVRFLLTVGVICYLISLISFHSFINLLVVFYGLSFFILLIYTKFKGDLFIKPNFQVFANPLKKEIFVFSGFILLANISGTIIQNVDSLVLSAYSGLKSTGIYSIALFIATVIEAPRRSMSQAIIPLVSEANKENDISKLEILYKKSSINQLIIGGFIFLLIWCNIDDIFMVIPHGDIYSAGKWVVFYIGIGKLFDMATGVNAEIVGTSKYYKYDLLFYTSLGLLAIVTNLIFIPVYGLVGAAIASALSVFLYNIMRFIFLLVKMRIQPFSISTLKALILLTLIASLNFVINLDVNFLLNILIKSTFITLLSAFTVWKFNLSEDLISLVKKYLR